MSGEEASEPGMTSTEACARFARWLEDRVLRAARGDDLREMEEQPSTRLWLGQLAPELAVLHMGLGERGERLSPCAIGMRFRPVSTASLRFICRVAVNAWVKADKRWRKHGVSPVDIPVAVSGEGTAVFGAAQLEAELKSATGAPGLRCEVRTEYGVDLEGNPELTVLLVNTSPEEHEEQRDTSLYECRLEVVGFDAKPYLLEGLPDSFRYDRQVPAYGINCGVSVNGGTFSTTDTVSVVRGRPQFWNVSAPCPDLAFKTLARNPLPSLEMLHAHLCSWGDLEWGQQRLKARASAESWNDAMKAEAEKGAADFRLEVQRVGDGVALLKSDQRLRSAFQLMNDAMTASSGGRYSAWRAFQMGFLLANLKCLVDRVAESKVADVVWFATGGGKTETYLGLVVMAAFLDRLQGKTAGVSAWSRFPLRMLSLQQTQRFADALAAAELVRRREGLGGAPFSVGFLVGEAATPNRLESPPKEGKPDPDDPSMPARYRVLLRCPFCHGEQLEMKFNRRIWTLEHRCIAKDCPWPKNQGFPFYVVDEEIYRFLPTVIVGTLDKAASISMQQAMRGLVGPPWGLCPSAGHGYTYAPRSTKPHGCLVPDCSAIPVPLDMNPGLFAPSLRLQDELHLVKDSLGAVDAHYEALLDHLQEVLGGARSKILGSSATLSGYEKQISVLYQRDARVFPALGPTATQGFWTSESADVARTFVALAPRGQTVDYAVDRTITELQAGIRRLQSDPKAVCRELGIPAAHVATLVDLYGVNVVYGNTLRDLDAAIRSFETQIKVDGRLNYASLTGRTPFDEVRETLGRLERPESNFEDRLHLVAASAMMSHGVDIDRLNTLLMVGVPLTAAEFIQTTARVGRRHPGLVFVFPKMARERDASVFRSFDHFVKQGDRLVEAIPITRRSRRVLDRTVAGLVFGRLFHVHEHTNGASLVMASKLAEYVRRANLGAEKEFNALVGALGLDDALDEPMRQDLRAWLDDLFQRIANPPPELRFATELGNSSPMLSLRDVEEQAPVYGTVT